MVTSSTASRPPPRSSHSHSHSQSQRSSTKSNASPLSPPRVAASVGQALPPSISNPHLRSPAIQQSEARTPSPNYFGLVTDPNSDPRDTGRPKDNWSPPTSSIRSFGAPSPKHLPLDANPDFEAFRRQTEEKHGFNLSHGNLTYFASTPSAQPRPNPARRPVRSETQDHSPKSKPQNRSDGVPDQMQLDNARQGRDKDMGAPSFFDIPRQQSPVNMNQNESNPPLQRNVLSSIDDRHPRLSLPQNKADPPSPHLNKLQTRNQQPRADTLPSALEDGPAMISVAQLKDILDKVPAPQFLLLDLRVFPQFSQSRIQGALNLCIPTTLLKRPSFNLQKLQDTFTIESEKARFCQWKEAKYLVVYDAFSSEKKDAISAINTLKKFSNEGYKGNPYILRGGFTEFQKHYPRLIDTGSNQDSQASKINLSLGTSGPGVAPVAGGCVMPATKNAANPFFSNIRQNQDLIGGVGQMDVKMPEMETVPQNVLPNWLVKAADPKDHGKSVSDMFLRLELAEKDRMSKALSSGVTYGSQANNKDVQLAGIEKGSKNRYNNIWPFEHARVKLQGRTNGACDYVNASHVKAARSNKQYIASQGPLPATFEDFWSVIWDHDVRVIVMLTAESEGGQLKCHPYWASKEFGLLKLKALSEKKVSLDTTRHRSESGSRRESGRRRATTTADNSPVQAQAETPHVVIRKFTLAHAGHPFSPIREITQIHYSSWPDFGAPASPAQLLSLVELTNMMQRAALSSTQSTRSDEPVPEEAARPMLVHCSAGCGRTGTFCTIDSVIDMLKRQRKEHKSGVTPMEMSAEDYVGKSKEGTVSGDWVFDQDMDLVEKTVEDFRGQRLSMVQSLRQYVLCYETVLEWIAQQQSGSSKPTRDRSGSDLGLERRPS